DTSAQDITRTQPMKLAAMEGLNQGGEGAAFTLIGFPAKDSQHPSDRMRTVKYDISIPKMLSFLGYHNTDAFVPGIKNILDGYTSFEGKTYPSVEQRMVNGRTAIEALKTYKTAVEEQNEPAAQEALKTLKENYADFGYGYLDSKYDVIPPISLVFYSFRIMVGAGMLFVLLFVLAWWYARKREFEKFRFIPYLALCCIPLAYIASQCGWIVAEVGRQPWVVQHLMPTNVAITRIASGWVITTFWMFAVLFTLLLVAEIGIMFTQIRKGVTETPKNPQNL
ncbi:MAG: cytochrome ubiquinol oxidase subunit I, partial [Odoribacter sp.]|nr:cytochrome ubiquinol oxidase subunit I [Odoribacter sp.]